MDKTDNTTSTIITNILKKYNLKESEEELVQKFFGKGEYLGESNGLTIFWIATKISEGEKTEEEALSILVERLHADKKTAEQIMSDIKQDLLPMLKREVKEEVKEEATPKPAATMPTKPPRPLKQEMGASYKKSNIPPKSKTKSFKEKPQEKKKAKDVYRESIE
jgi:hypothetical protein